MNVSLRSLAVLLATSAALSLCAQPAAKPAESPAVSSYPASYVDLPLPQLRKSIPALQALQPDDSQANLSSILFSVAQTIQDAVPQLPDLISREIVYRSQVRSGQEAPQQMIAVAGGGGGIVIAPQGVHPLEYRYLILCRHTSDSISVEESRTDSSGHPVNLIQADANPLGSGFAYQWLLFSAANQREFRFRSLGTEQMQGRPTYVIAFAQIPDQVKIPAVFRWRDKQASYYYQGILWVDQESSQIVLLRTDLLAPLRSVQLVGLTTELQFSSVHIGDYQQDFWLPRQVHMKIAQERYDIDEVHQYSDYRLYHSTATIIPER